MKKITSSQIQKFEDIEKLQKITRAEVEVSKTKLKENFSQLKKDVAITAVFGKGLDLVLNYTGLSPMLRRGAALAGSVATNVVVKKIVPQDLHLVQRVELGFLQALSKGASGIISALKSITPVNGKTPQPENIPPIPNLREKVAKLQQRYPHLTDDDIVFIEGKDEMLINRLRIKLGKSKEDIIRLLNSL